MSDLKLLGHDDEPQNSGAVVAVNWGYYKEQELWVRSGANIGNWYPLGNEFFRSPKVADDTRSYPERMTSRGRWVQPEGTIPTHPVWTDVLSRGPVVLLCPAGDEPYKAGWRAGRVAMAADISGLVEDLSHDYPAEKP